MGFDERRGTLLGKTALLVGASTLVLTASFVGLLGLLTAGAADLGTRVPFYAVVAGLAFAVAIFLLEENRREGRAILVSAIVFAVITVVVVGLSVEGVMFALRSPERVFVSQLIYYVIAAALIGTGIGFWLINHWREFTTRSSRGL